MKHKNTNIIQRPIALPHEINLRQRYRNRKRTKPFLNKRSPQRVHVKPQYTYFPNKISIQRSMCKHLAYRAAACGSFARTAFRKDEK